MNEKGQSVLFPIILILFLFSAIFLSGFYLQQIFFFMQTQEVDSKIILSLLESNTKLYSRIMLDNSSLTVYDNTHKRIKLNSISTLLNPILDSNRECIRVQRIVSLNGKIISLEFGECKI